MNYSKSQIDDCHPILIDSGYNQFSNGANDERENVIPKALHSLVRFFFDYRSTTFPKLI